LAIGALGRPLQDAGIHQVAQHQQVVQAYGLAQVAACFGPGDHGLQVHTADVLLRGAYRGQ
jgi:hypothetical protein